jgi:hypothetical protein
MRPRASFFEFGSEHAVSLGSNARQRSFKTTCLRVNYWKHIATSGFRVSFVRHLPNADWLLFFPDSEGVAGRPDMVGRPLWRAPLLFVLRRVCVVAGTGWR